jgi:aspartate/methionine/tyrosine aminotransferase
MNESWLKLYAPDFSAYDRLSADNSIKFLSADPFTPSAVLPAHVLNAVKDALDAGKTHYSEYPMEPTLTEAVVNKLRTFNGFDIDPESELIGMPSSAFSLYLAILFCIRPGVGDEVLNIDPGFAENFNDVYQMGAVNVSVPVFAEDGFQFRIEEVRKVITERTRCIVLTNPNNPTGTVYTRESLLQLAELVKEHDIMVVVDQAFERQIYDGIEYTNFALLPDMWERTITVFGTSKDLGLPGFRISYIAARREIIEILRPALFNMHGAPNTFAQYGVAAAYNDPSYTDEWFRIFEARRSLGQRELDAIPGVHCQLPDAGYYFWADISELGTSSEIVDFLIDDADVGVGPGTWFGERGEGFVRIMYGAVAEEASYVEGIERIVHSLTKLAASRGIR